MFTYSTLLRIRLPRRRSTHARSGEGGLRSFLRRRSNFLAKQTPAPTFEGFYKTNEPRVKKCRPRGAVAKIC